MRTCEECIDPGMVVFDTARGIEPGRSMVYLQTCFSRSHKNASRAGRSRRRSGGSDSAESGRPTGEHPECPAARLAQRCARRALAPPKPFYQQADGSMVKSSNIARSSVLLQGASRRRLRAAATRQCAATRSPARTRAGATAAPSSTPTPSSPPSSSSSSAATSTPCCTRAGDGGA